MKIGVFATWWPTRVAVSDARYEDAKDWCCSEIGNPSTHVEGRAWNAFQGENRTKTFAFGERIPDTVLTEFKLRFG